MGGPFPYTSDFRRSSGLDRQGHGNRDIEGRMAQANRARNKRNTVSRPFYGSPDTRATADEIHFPGMASGREFLVADAADQRTTHQSSHREREAIMAQPDELPRSTPSYQKLSEQR
jgi:hypothetical protein